MRKPPRGTRKSASCWHWLALLSSSDGVVPWPGHAGLETLHVWGSIPHHSTVGQWRNWKTHRLWHPASGRICGFESRLPHPTLAQAGGNLNPSGLCSLTLPLALALHIEDVCPPSCGSPSPCAPHLSACACCSGSRIPRGNGLGGAPTHGDACRQCSASTG